MNFQESSLQLECQWSQLALAVKDEWLGCLGRLLHVEHRGELPSQAWIVPRGTGVLLV